MRFFLVTLVAAAGVVYGCMGRSSNGDSNADEVVAEYMNHVDAVRRGPFVATYQVSTGGRSPWGRGTVTWWFDERLGQRFDVDVIQFDDTRVHYSYIDSVDGRLMCYPEKSICSDPATTRGGDLVAIGFGLPHDAAWQITEGGRSRSPVGKPSVETTPLGRCFTFAYSKLDLTWEECFAEDSLTVRRLRAGTTAEWKQISREPLASNSAFLEAPFPVVDPN